MCDDRLSLTDGGFGSACTWTFTIENLPDADEYMIRADTQQVHTWSRAGIESSRWRVAIRSNNW